VFQDASGRVTTLSPTQFIAHVSALKNPLEQAQKTLDAVDPSD
jgi:hypothetical protein